MRRVTFSRNGVKKLGQGKTILVPEDFESFPSGVTPGEWFELVDKEGNERTWGFSLQTQPSEVQLISRFLGTSYLRGESAKNFSAAGYLNFCLGHSASQREILLGKDQSRFCRFFFGEEDGLKGLIVDRYDDLWIVEVNSQGAYGLFPTLVEFLRAYCPNSKIHLKPSTDESIPGIAQIDELPERIQISDGGFKYSIEKSRMQKLGFYYDHRFNRKKFEQLLGRIEMEKGNGLDLYCYLGAWGMHALRGGVERMTFVDQGNLETDVKDSLALNALGGKGEYVRSDVFQFLKEQVVKGNKFQVVLADPPAFCKSMGRKGEAITGYTKLASLIGDVLAEKALVCFSSCTKYVNILELDEAFRSGLIKTKTNKRIQLLDLGIQDWDHPTSSLTSTSSYIKYLAYYVES